MKLSQHILPVLLLLLFPVALVGMLLPVNEYAALGINGPDCDGPFGVLLFTIPSLIVYGLATIHLSFLWYRKNNPHYLAASFACLMVVGLLVPNTLDSIKESEKNSQLCFRINSSNLAAKVILHH